MQSYNFSRLTSMMYIHVYTRMVTTGVLSITNIITITVVIITITRDINLLEPLSHLLLEVLSLGRVLCPHVLVASNDHVAKMLATDDQKSC